MVKSVLNLKERRGGFSEGLDTSRRRHVIQGTNTSSRDLTGYRHVVAVYQLDLMWWNWGY